MAVICPECRSENTEDSKFCKTCASPITSPDISSSVTKTLASPLSSPGKSSIFAGRYEILSTLGRGGMGDVYRVRDTKLQEQMALKLLRPEIAFDSDAIQRFRNELKLARKITHRNVCRVFDFHEEEGTPFITMEYVDGEDLKSLIKRKGRLEENEAIGIATQITEGLVEAHDLGVVHRDLKPQNIMIEPGGRAKIMDFGIARSLQASGLTQTGQMIGTPDYLSSEQAAGQPADHRADIYALGVILFEMATGQLPFKGDTALSVITKHRETEAIDPRKINPEISPGLSRLILRCMEKDKENRYQSSRELLEDLHSLSKGEQLKKAYKKKKGRLFHGWRKIGLISAATLALLVVLIFLWKTQEQSPVSATESERPSLGVVYFENNTGDENLDHWRKAFAELLIADLSQSKYLKVLPGDQMYKILGDLDQLEASAYSSDILKQVALKGKVRNILRGSYIKAGSMFRVSISLQDMETGELLGSQTAEADGEENLFALVDDLTKRIKSDMHMTSEQIETDIDRDAADVMTSSPEAYRLFVEGLRHHYRAEYQLCIEFMEKAIAIDPEFASAYGWKAFSYDSMGYHEEFIIAMTKAYELRHRVTERERFKITAYYYLRAAGDIPKAVEELQKYISLYPEDMFANHMLGYLNFLIFEDYDKAVEYFKHNIENRVYMFYSYYVMAWTQMCLGNYEKARDVCELYISEYGDHPEIRFKLSINYFCQGDYDRALAEAKRAAELGFSGSFWNGLIEGGIQQAQGNIAGAEASYQNMADSRDVLVRVVGMESLGELALLQGRYGVAKSQIERALDLVKATKDKANMTRLHTHLAYIDLQTGNFEECLEACGEALEYGKYSMDAISAIKLALHVKGLCQLRMGDFDAAIKTAEEMKVASAKDPSRRSRRDYLNLVGHIEMMGGNTSNAIKQFEEAASLLPAQNQLDLAGFKNSLRRTIYLASLAEGYFRAGMMDKAQQTCEALTGLTIGCHHWGDLYVKANYTLGQISEKQGKPDEAAAHYQKFLELWKDADSGIPELSDAKVRLDLLLN